MPLPVLTPLDDLARSHPDSPRGRGGRSRLRLIALLVLVFAFCLSGVVPALAYDALVTNSLCGLDGCHTLAGYAGFTSWHTSHQALGGELPCESCHPNNHTTPGPASAPEATYSLAVACSLCHDAMEIAPAHSAAGVLSCIDCHPRSGTLAGHVYGVAGPLVGAAITIEGGPSVLTYDGGQYVAARVPAGAYRVTYSMGGYVSKTITDVLVAYRGQTTRDVTLVPLDLTAPTTTSDAEPSYDFTATIHLFTSDNPGGSGVSSTQWRLDAGAWTDGTSILTTSSGDHRLAYRSCDFAGNVEDTRSVSFVVRTLPALGVPNAPTTMYRTRTYSVWGSLSPKHLAGTYPVRVYKWRRTASGVWKSYGYVLAKATDYNGATRYSCSVRLPYAGRWRLRAYATPDTYHVATWSAADRTVTVR